MTDVLSFYEPLLTPGGDPHHRDAPASTRHHASRQQRQKAARRQRIVEAAASLFSAKGYNASSLHDIAEQADVSVSTLRRHFPAKVDLALEQVRQWTADFVETMEARPERETPDQMLAATLRWLDDEDYRGVPSGVMAVISAEQSVAIAGQIHLVMIEKERALSTLFTRRLEYPPGSIEPRIIAAAFIAAWRVAVYASAELSAAGHEVSAPDELGLACFAAFTQGLDQFWTKGDEPDLDPSMAGPAAGSSSA